MLNTKALSELLSQNTDERLCKRWYLLTPNGTLLAHSHPTDIKDLRKQVAIAALEWQEHQLPTAGDENGDSYSSPKPERSLHMLIKETETSNVLIRQIEPQLLLVLEGGIPPRKRSFEPRITAEASDGDPLYNHRTEDSALGTSLSSKAESSRSATVSGVLGLHRRKLDAMASAIHADFERTGFQMPESGAYQLF